jgi:hypothetical protein
MTTFSIDKAPAACLPNNAASGEHRQVETQMMSLPSKDVDVPNQHPL